MQIFAYAPLLLWLHPHPHIAHTEPDLQRTMFPTFILPFPSIHMCTPSPPSPRIRTDQSRAKDFLTQRAVQQTLFCSRVLRDETTLSWLQEFLDHHGLDDLHHCDALKCDSEQYLTALFKQPPIAFEIKKPIPGRVNSNNPYITRRYFTYDVEIVPRKLGLRILVRVSSLCLLVFLLYSLLCCCKVFMQRSADHV